MNDNPNVSRFAVAGLKDSGKTSLICGLIQLAHKHHFKFAGFKPFDNNLLKLNASEELSDGEQFCRYMSGEPMETLVSPYIGHESYPLEMTFRRDGIRVNWGYVAERLGLLDQLYDTTLIELPNSLFTPITEAKMAHEWLKELDIPLIWLINPTLGQFEQNLAEITAFRSLNIPFHLIINNAGKITDQDQIFYIWEKVESVVQQEIAGMIPHIKDVQQSVSLLGDKIELNLPDLINRLFEFGA